MSYVPLWVFGLSGESTEVALDLVVFVARGLGIQTMWVKDYIYT